MLTAARFVSRLTLSVIALSGEVRTHGGKRQR